MALVIVALVGMIGPAAAQTIQSGGTIDEIEIRGTRRIEPATVRSYLTVDPGDPFDRGALNQTLKELFDTGLFSDVRLRRDGDRLIVEIDENPIINRIAFEGNDEVDDKTLRQQVELRPRVVFTRTKVKNDLERIRRVYRRNGRFGAEISPKIIELEQNRVDLVFEINEGPETKVRGINFLGNRAFDDGELRDAIVTTEAAWYRLFATNDTYDPNRINFDRQKLRRFYLNNGYADFQVDSVISEMTPDRKGFILTFSVDEGPRYKIESVTIDSQIDDLTPKSLRKVLNTKEGDWYNASKVQDTVDRMTTAAGNQGFAFVDIQPNVERLPDKNRIKLTYTIEEAPRVFIERINITGNVRTLDRVIRREFEIVEGDAFNASKIRRARQRINNLGFFKSVEVDKKEGSSPSRTVVDVKVEERSTGSLSFGAGVSTDSGLLGNVQLRERNLLGKGQDLQLNFSLSFETQRIDLSFTEPYFLGRDLSAGFDLFRTETDQDELDFEEDRTGGALRTGYSIIGPWRQSWRYRFSERELSDVDDDESLVLQLEEGSTTRSSLSHTLSYDRRDNRLNPTEGFKLSLTNTFAGLGGSERFAKNEVSADVFTPITEGLTLHLGAEGGHIAGLGKETSILDRFFVGSSSIRGFQPAGVGPRDLNTDDALGAKQFYAGTVELRFPLGLPDRFNIEGRVWSDVGAAWGVDNPSNANLQTRDSSSPRLAVGTGFSWRSPLGPLDIDLGFPVIKEDFDETEVFQFGFGTQF
ncbi:Beta-barrel assembly machine subunit BamA [Limimonas halophila]|uniref:Outer membrane protein assembly factor BamA n=1 Tax=Limimonas halophila TaxID=1082479 RepID=A0A1G7N9P6_9PROT|nr:outer membrane protein assembly factor BamA [Limimonas halophila]SDF70676.1 Beta-barrel assembly machine subunit BamA [Limimonas halophila]